MGLHQFRESGKLGGHGNPIELMACWHAAGAPDCRLQFGSATYGNANCNRRAAHGNTHRDRNSNSNLYLDAVPDDYVYTNHHTDSILYCDPH